MGIMEKAGVEEGSRKRRSRTKQERRRIVEETFEAGASVANVARRHGIRANQVFHWRRLYQQGLLGNMTENTALVPVRIADTVAPTRVQMRAEAYAQRVASKPRSGTIEVELANARICIQGAADPVSLRVVLESLLG
jgi:transposase